MASSFGKNQYGHYKNEVTFLDKFISTIVICVLIVLFVILLHGLLKLLQWVFPKRCRHGWRLSSNAKNPCPVCIQEKEVALNELNTRLKLQAEMARQEEERKRQEILHLRMLETENLRKLDYLKSLDPTKFEHVVLQMYRNLGWEAEATAKTGDNGIDGILTRDGKKYILQCKRWSTDRVGEPDIRDLFGATSKERATGGILVTTSSFTAQAIAWARAVPLELIDGIALVSKIQKAFPEGNWIPSEFVMKSYIEASLPTKCPQCGRPTRKRIGKYGPFLGCTGYPECRWLADLPDEMAEGLPLKTRRYRKRIRYGK